MASRGAGSSKIRQRKPASKSDERKEQKNSENLNTSDMVADDEPLDKAVDVKKIEPGSYWLTRVVFVRALGFLYCNQPACMHTPPTHLCQSSIYCYQQPACIHLCQSPQLPLL